MRSLEESFLRFLLLLLFSLLELASLFVRRACIRAIEFYLYQQPNVDCFTLITLYEIIID